MSNLWRKGLLNYFKWNKENTYDDTQVQEEDMVILLREDEGANQQDILVSIKELGIGTSPPGNGEPMYISIVALAEYEGNLHLSDADWETSSAQIKTIKVDTTSTNWDLYLLQNGNGYIVDDARIPAKTLMIGGNKTESITLDYAYEDEDNGNELHLYYVDNDGGTHTASFFINGFKLTT